MTTQKTNHCKRPWNLALLCVLGFLLVGCSATRKHMLTTLEPAKVELDAGITRIGIVNEHNTSGESVYRNRLEALLAQRDGRLEEDGINAAITGLFEELQKDKRFESVTIIHTESLKDEMGKTQKIPWEAITGICRANNVDVLFSLSFYEAETELSVKQKMIEEQNMLRETVRLRGHEITLETLIENGWRIYEPHNRRVVDEIVLNQQMTEKGQGSNPLYALDAIGDHRHAVLVESSQAGGLYGKRLLPKEQEVARDYYTKGSKSLSEARKMALKGDFEGASTLWKKETVHKRAKIRARACYNMAFYEETQGRFALALSWAEKALDIASNKKMLDYAKTLEERIDQEKIVLHQLQRSRLSASVQQE